MAKQKTHKKAGAASLPIRQTLWQHKHFFNGLVFLFALILFANSIPNDYNMDDELVTINHRLTSKGISAIPEIFTSPYYQDAQGYSYEYRPVVLASFAFEHQFFGDNAHVGHFFNVVLYALCCLALYLVLLRLFKNQSPIIPLAVTLLFIAHPAHTEVVCSIKNRDEILGLLFSFLAMLAALKAIQDSKKWMIFLIPVFFTLALMSKITVISFVILIPLAIILFTEAGLGAIILNTLMLQIPSYFLLNLSSGFEKMMAQIGITAVVLVFYVLVNPKVCIVSIRNFMGEIYKKAFQTESSVLNNDLEGPKEYGLKDILKGIMPDKKLFVIRPFLITAFFMSLYLSGIVLEYSALTFPGIIVLLFLAWKGEEKIVWWAFVMINLVPLINLYKSPYIEDSVNTIALANCGAQYLAYQLIFGRRNLFIPTFLSFIAFHIISIIKCHHWEALDTIVFVILLFNQYLRYILFLMNLFFAISALFSIDVTSGIPIIQYLSSTLIIVTVHFKKWSKPLLLFLAGVSAILFHVYMARTNHPFPIRQAIGMVVEGSNQINPKIISSVEDRPIQYVEECVSAKDPVSVRLGTSLDICFHYLQKVILPYPLSYYYGYKFIKPMKITDTIPIISLSIHILLFLLAAYLIHKDPLISFGLFTYLFSIALFSNYLQYIPGMVADRYLLVPSLGWSIIVVGFIRKFSGMPDRVKNINWKAITPATKYSFLSILLLYSVLTFSRNTYWKDDLTLFRHDIEYVNESSQAHNLLALHLMIRSTKESNIEKQNALTQEALLHFKKALEIYPRFFNIAYDIGRVYTSLNMPDSAITAFKYALTIDTSFRDVQFNIGKLLFERDRLEEAIPYFENVIQFNPSEYKSYDQLSYLFFRLNKVDKSIEVNRLAINNLPSLPDPYINIGRAYLGVKQSDSARYYFQKANEIAPGNPAIQQLLQQVSAP